MHDKEVKCVRSCARRTERTRQTTKVSAADLLWAQPVFGRGRHGLAPPKGGGDVAPGASPVSRHCKFRENKFLFNPLSIKKKIITMLELVVKNQNFRSLLACTNDLALRKLP